jgi:hypothetical protein
LEGSTSFGNRWMGSNQDMQLVEPPGSNIEFIVNAASKYTFTPNGSGGFNSPATNRALTLEHDTTDGVYVVTNTRNYLVAIFYDFAHSPLVERGKLKEVTSVQWKEMEQTDSTRTGVLYGYDTEGYVNQITTAGMQAYNITIEYVSGASQRVRSIEVFEGTTKLRKVEYKYYDDVSGTPSHLGSTGDLVQVKYSRRASTDSPGTLSIVRYKQYRYDSDSRLKAVYNHSAVNGVISAFTGIDDPDDVLAAADTYPGAMSNPQVQDFATRAFTYYATDEPTTDIATPWNSNDDLQGDYTTATGTAANRDEEGFVKTERIGGGACSTCGSTAGGGVTKHYSYMELDTGSTVDDNEVTYLIVEDTTDATNAPTYRKIICLNSDGRALRNVFIDNPNTSPKYW